APGAAAAKLTGVPQALQNRAPAARVAWHVGHSDAADDFATAWPQERQKRAPAGTSSPQEAQAFASDRGTALGEVAAGGGSSGRISRLNSLIPRPRCLPASAILLVPKIIVATKNNIIRWSGLRSRSSIIICAPRTNSSTNILAMNPTRGY